MKYYLLIDQDGAIDMVNYSPSQKALIIHYNQRVSDASNMCDMKSAAVTG